MAKAKTASKNNPTTREQVKEFFHNGKKIKPVLVLGERAIRGAEYESGDLVLDSNGLPMTWERARRLS